MRPVSLFLVIGSLAACDNPLALSTDHLTLQVVQSVGKLPDDPLTVTGARVVGTDLELDLQYGGGCRDHRFGIVAGRNLGESLPPYTVLRIAHDDAGDGCKVMVSRSILVDLRPIEPLVRRTGASSLRFEIVEPGERFSKVGERRVDF